MDNVTYAIKVKKPEDRVWLFLTSHGKLNRLKVYATQWPDREAVKDAAEKLRQEHRDYWFKVVEL